MWTYLVQLPSMSPQGRTAAGELGVSYNTIKFHMRHIYEKLQVHSKSEAVAKALQNRLV